MSKMNSQMKYGKPYQNIEKRLTFRLLQLG